MATDVNTMFRRAKEASVDALARIQLVACAQQTLVADLDHIQRMRA